MATRLCYIFNEHVRMSELNVFGSWFLRQNTVSYTLVAIVHTIAQHKKSFHLAVGSRRCKQNRSTEGCSKFKVRKHDKLR